jgi:FkbM family methyltransferase
MLKGFLKRAIPAPLWWRLRLAWHWWRTQHYPSRVVVHSYGGTLLRVHLADLLAETWYDHDWSYPTEFVELGKRTLHPGALVFDLGAHQGVVALMLADAVGPAGKVVAVEANPHNAAQCLRNRELNRMSWIEVVQAAVSDRSGSLLFNRGFNGIVDRPGNEWGRIKVSAVTIDELAERHGCPDLLFIDVEGFECHALRGAKQTLAACPDCFIEVHSGLGLEEFGGSVDEVVSYFPPELYHFVYYTERQDQLLAASPEGLPRGQRLFLLALRRAEVETARSRCANLGSKDG